MWHALHTTWSDTQRNIFAIQLQDVDISGLDIPPIRAGYMVAYRNNLIGKHFKSIAQTLTFKTYGLVSPKMRTLVRTMGELSAVLWITEIYDMDEHKVSVWNIVTLLRGLNTQSVQSSSIL